jgi:Protein of unknown function (DUF5818)
MRRAANALAFLAFWLVTTPFSFSQNKLNEQPCPDCAEEALGCELIAWSQLNEPAPLPDATSPSTLPEESANEFRSQFPQTFTGVIFQNEGRYCLRVNAGLALMLDDQRTAQRHEGERVKIKGRLDAGGTTLRVQAISPIS